MCEHLVPSGCPSSGDLGGQPYFGSGASGCATRKNARQTQQTLIFINVHGCVNQPFLAFRVLPSRAWVLQVSSASSGSSSVVPPTTQLEAWAWRSEHRERTCDSHLLPGAPMRTYRMLRSLKQWKHLPTSWQRHRDCL